MRGSTAFTSGQGRAEATAAIERMIAGDIDDPDRHADGGEGHHFPLLPLSCVIDADSGQRRDGRAAERTFQTILPVAGQAGRSSRAGPWMQTHMPEHRDAGPSSRSQRFFRPDRRSPRHRHVALIGGTRLLQVPDPASSG